MYDSNGDGHIDFREFMIVLYIMSNGTPEENLKQVIILVKKKWGFSSKKTAKMVIFRLNYLFEFRTRSPASMEISKKSFD